MVSVYDMATGETITDADAESTLHTQQWAPGLDVMPRLQPVATEVAPEAARQLPADIAMLPVELLLAKQI